MNLDLRDIPAVYINLAQETERNESMKLVLNDCGFKNIIRIDAKYTPARPLAGCSISHYNALQEIDPPFIVFEDDCIAKEYNPIIRIPDDTDALYLGISSWGRFNSHSGPFVQYDKVDDNLLRVYNMLGTHAILYLNDEYVSACKKVAYKQYEIEDYIDIGFTDLQKYYKVYSFDEPPFYQSSSNGTDGRLTDYPSEECFTYQKPYWLPSRVN